MGQRYEGSPAFREAVRLFRRSPQTMLVRHIYISLVNDPGYLLNNGRSIELAVHSILATQGMDPEKAFERSSVLELIRVAGRNLNIRVSEDMWTRVSSWQLRERVEDQVHQ